MQKPERDREHSHMRTSHNEKYGNGAAVIELLTSEVDDEFGRDIHDAVKVLVVGDPSNQTWTEK